MLPVVHFQNLLTCSIHANSTPVCTGSDTTANLAVLQTRITDPKSCDVSFQRRGPDMQSCTLLGAYILLMSGMCGELLFMGGGSECRVMMFVD